LPTATLAIDCLKCDQTLKLNFSEVLNTTVPGCHETVQSDRLCFSRLSIEFKNKTASVTFNQLSEQTLIFSNGHKMTTNSITVWFNKDITTQSYESICSDTSTCVEDVNKTYNISKFDEYKYRSSLKINSKTKMFFSIFFVFFLVKNFEHVELRTKLRERLYSVQSHVHNLTCSNNQGQTVFCPNGFCRLIRRGISNVDRICVSQGTGSNPSGIIIQLYSMDGFNNETMFTYACNKPMCNGVETDAQVQQLLQQYVVSPTLVTLSLATTEKTPSTENITTLPEVTPSTENVTTSSKGNSVMTTVYQTVATLQWMLLLITAVFWKM
jgi:hypothetical protein